MEAKNYRTLSEASKNLRQQGYSDRFEMEDEGLRNLENGKYYQPEELRIVEMHRFEGVSNPSDMSVIFAVECEDDRKGVVVSSYGTYANRDLLKFMDEVERTF